MTCDGAPVAVRAWQRRDATVVVRADAVDDQAGRECLERAIERMRFALGVDDDYQDFYDQFDPTACGPRGVAQALGAPAPAPLAVGGARMGGHRAAHRRPARERDPAPHRPPLGPTLAWGQARLRDVPAPRRSRAAPRPSSRAATWRRSARWRWSRWREAASGRADLTCPEDDARLLKISNIGPWTVQCLGSSAAATRLAPSRRPRLRQADRPPREPRPPRHRRGGRGVLRALQALRGLAGMFMLSGYHSLVAQGLLRRLAA